MKDAESAWEAYALANADKLSGFERDDFIAGFEAAEARYKGARQIVANLLLGAERQLEDLRSAHGQLGTQLQRVERDVSDSRDKLREWGWPEGELDQW